MPPVAAPALRARRHNALGAQRREEILEAAIRLFGRKGFEATRAEDIAAAAKLAKGTIYLYFKNKDAIYVAAIAQSVKDLESEIARRSEGATGFREKLATAIRVRLEFWAEHEGIYRLLLTVGREVRLRRQTNEVMRNAQASLTAIFAEGLEAGETAPANFKLLAWTILDMIRGAAERRMNGLSATTPQADAAWITECVLRQLGLSTTAQNGRHGDT